MSAIWPIFEFADRCPVCVCVCVFRSGTRTCGPNRPSLQKSARPCHVGNLCLHDFAWRKGRESLFRGTLPEALTGSGKCTVCCTPTTVCALRKARPFRPTTIPLQNVVPRPDSARPRFRLERASLAPNPNAHKSRNCFRGFEVLCSARTCEKNW